MSPWKKLAVVLVPWLLALEGAEAKPLLQALEVMARTMRMSKPRKLCVVRG